MKKLREGLVIEAPAVAFDDDPLGLGLGLAGELPAEVLPVVEVPDKAGFGESDGGGGVGELTSEGLLETKGGMTASEVGGDRDQDKRPLMGGIAEKFSDFAILTSDNPRTEDPEEIIAQTKAGMSGARAHAIVDRRQAISEAIRLAGERDIVLIAGKGHESYQEIDGVRHPFDDRKVAGQIIAAKAEGTL